MRIGIFTDTYLPYVSGLVTSELMLKQALESMGHEVYIVTANLEKMKYDYDEENKIIRISGIPTKIYDTRLTGFYSIPAINQIRKWKLDIIHTQTEFGVGTFGRIVAKEFNIPLVHTYHTMYEDYVYYLTHGYFDKTSKKLVEYLTRFYCDTTISELIVPSRKIYNQFKAKYDIDKKINIIGTGMDIERFNPANFDKDKINKLKTKYDLNDKFVIGSVCRLGKEKSVDRLIINFREVLNKIPNARLLLIGDGPDKEELENLVSDLDIKSSVIFAGKVPIIDVQIYYQIMNVFSTFSTTETQGLTVLEAIASSIPVLAIKDDSYMDAIIDNKNGYLFKNDKEFIDYCYKLYSDKNLYNKLSIGALETAKDHSALVFGEKVYKVYQDTIDSFKKKNNILYGIKDVILPRKKGDKE